MYLVGFIIRKLEQHCFRHFITLSFLKFFNVKISLINKRILCITRKVEHNHILPSSTV